MSQVLNIETKKEKTYIWQLNMTIRNQERETT